MKYFIKSISFTIFVAVFFSGPTNAFAAVNLIPDTSFVLGTGFSVGNIVDPMLQSDGKVIVPLSGLTLSYNGTTIPNIIRLNPDGTVDSSFNSGTGFTLNGIRHAYLRSDGKIMVGGTFTSYNGTTMNRIARLNSDGTLDTSFNIGTGFNSTVYPVTTQPDGKVITSGFFTTYNGTAVPRIIRLNSDGTLDTTFITNTGSNANNYAWFAVVQPDGKILVGGVFTTFNGVTANRIARLNSDGTLDTTFATNVGTGFDNTIQHITLAPDGKILVGGVFTTFNGVTANRIARLNSDGTLDTSFNIGTGFDNTVQSMLILPNGKIVVGGNFTLFNGTTANRIVGLNANGTLDTEFVTGTGFDNNVYMYLLRQTDGKIIVPGSFQNFNGLSAKYLTRLTDASAPTLTPITLTSNNTNPSYAKVGDIITLSFSTDDALTGSTITIGGQTVTPVCNDTGLATIPCTATLTVTAGIPLTDGIVPFSITAVSNGGTTGPVTATTNSSSVTVDRSIAPVTILTPTNNTSIYGGLTTISGTCDASVTTVTITGTGFTPSPTTTTCTGGTYSAVVTITTGGTITTTQTDLANNTSTATSTYMLTATSGSSGSLGGGSWSSTTAGKDTSVAVSTTPVTTPTKLPTTTAGTTYISPVDGTTKDCRPFTTYLKIGKKNDTSEVKLWQAFLNKHMGEKLMVSGTYNKTTESAIKRFQSKYADEVLKPWGLTKPTGYTYQSTRAQGNKILGCGEGSVTLDNGVVIK